MPMMRSEYLMHFCSHCLRDQEHVRLTFNEQATLTCQFCQETNEVSVEATGKTMKKSFTVVSILEKDRNLKSRRWVIAEILCKEEPERASDGNARYATILIRYPAWGSESHYIVSLTTHPEGKNLPHNDSMAIAKELKFAMGFKT